jgi:hypothetical protein
LRVRVRFRFNSRTGEVETFTVDDLPDGQRAPDHDDRHDAVTADVGRVVDPHPRITEDATDVPAVTEPVSRQTAGEDETSPGVRERARE